MINIGVIGAGMAGITCANYLFSKGFEVTVYEKSRGLGGRMATKRINSDLSIDCLLYTSDAADERSV